MKLHFHGQSCWTVSDGDHRVLIDPFLRDNPLADVKPEDVTGIAAEPMAALTSRIEPTISVEPSDSNDCGGIGAVASLK